MDQHYAVLKIKSPKNDFEKITKICIIVLTPEDMSKKDFEFDVNLDPDYLEYRNSHKMFLENFRFPNVRVINEDHIIKLRNFLDSLPKPLNLIAHNGDEYDFKLLKNIFYQFEMKIPKNIHFWDSQNIYSGKYEKWYDELFPEDEKHLRKIDEWAIRDCALICAIVTHMSDDFIDLALLRAKTNEHLKAIKKEIELDIDYK